MEYERRCPNHVPKAGIELLFAWVRTLEHQLYDLIVEDQFPLRGGSLRV